MKTLIFKNGGTIDFVECYSSPEYVQGAQRDVLDFRFNAEDQTLDSIDALFTADECSKLTIRETTIEQVQAVDENGDPVIEQVSVLDEEGNAVTKEVSVLDEDGNPTFDEEGNPVVTVVPVTEEVPVMQDVEHVEEFVHENYGLRVALSKQRFTLATENGTEEVEQISVKMGQFTYTEMQVASLTDTVDVLVMESLMA